MRGNKLSCHVWMLIGVLIGRSAPCSSAMLTVEEIVKGIELRSSKVSSIELQYRIADTHEEAFYSKLQNEYEQIKSNAKEGERVELPVPEYMSIEKNVVDVFRIFEEGNRKAYETFAVNLSNNERNLTTKGVYDGETLKHLNVQELNGVIERRNPNDIIKFPTVPFELGLEGSDFASYLKREDIKCELVNESIVNGELIAELNIKRTFVPSPNSPIEVVTEHIVKINASKDFWPIQIEKYAVLNNYKTGEKIRRLKDSVTVSDFTENNGMYYPASFVHEEYDYDYEYKPNSLLPTVSENKKLLTTRSVMIEKVEINSDLPDDVFTFEFPPGTRYHDSILGYGAVVGGDPVDMASKIAESMSYLDVDTFTEEEARQIIALRNRGLYKEAQRLKDAIMAQKTGLNETVATPYETQEFVSEMLPINEETEEGVAAERIQVPVVYKYKKGWTFYYYAIPGILFCTAFAISYIYFRKRVK